MAKETGQMAKETGQMAKDQRFRNMADGNTSYAVG